MFFFETKDLHSDSFDLCGQVDDKFFFSRPILGNKTTFFWPKETKGYNNTFGKCLSYPTSAFSVVMYILSFVLSLRTLLTNNNGS